MKKQIIFYITVFAYFTVSAQHNFQSNYYSTNDQRNEHGWCNTGAHNPYTYQYFYDQLRPYGFWVNHARYGYCWVPSRAGSGFRPYLTNGQWVYTDYGWTWFSGYSWGWAPFHYGRWFFDYSFGWMWMPGNEWAPAWVNWGYYSGYYCWAPQCPDMYGNSNQYPDYGGWNFISYREMGCNNVDHHAVHKNYFKQNNIPFSENQITAINHSAISGNAKYNFGPKLSDVERNSGKKIIAVSISNSEQPGSSRVSENKYKLFCPEINKTEISPSGIAGIKSNSQLHQGNIKTILREDRNNISPNQSKLIQPNQDVMKQVAPVSGNSNFSEVKPANGNGFIANHPNPSKVIETNIRTGNQNYRKANVQNQNKVTHR